MDIKNIIETRKDELYQILSNLIKIDSQSSCVGGNEKAIAEYIAKEIEKWDIRRMYILRLISRE